MENKKILATVLATWILALGATSVFAMENSPTNLPTKSVSMMNWKFSGKEDWTGSCCNKMQEKMGMNDSFINLTDEEKNKLASMTQEEKQTFFETKMEENSKKMELRETVIDKLLSGASLTADEEKIRQDIIKERADRKAEQEKKAKIKNILEKNSNGETLTDEEKQLLLEHFLDKKSNKMGKWFKNYQK